MFSFLPLLFLFILTMSVLVYKLNSQRNRKSFDYQHSANRTPHIWPTWPLLHIRLLPSDSYLFIFFFFFLTIDLFTDSPSDYISHLQTSKGKQWGNKKYNTQTTGINIVSVFLSCSLTDVSSSEAKVIPTAVSTAYPASTTQPPQQGR